MKRTLFSILSGALLLLLVGLGAWRIQAISSERQAERIVRHALEVEDRVGYIGQKVSRLRVGERLVEVTALVARRPLHMRRIHYITPPLAGVTIWQDGQRTYRYVPNGKQLEIYDKSRHHHDGIGDEETLVLRNYQPRLEGVETVAGRPAYRIRLAPRHPGDAWTRLWIDRKDYLRLASEDYDGNDHLVRATRFKEVELDSLDPDQFRPTSYLMGVARRTYTDEEKSKSVEQVSRAVGFPIRMPEYVPEGYVFDGAYTYPCECGCERPAAQVRWSNGLNTISLFQCSHPCGAFAACSVTTSSHTASFHIAVGKESFLFVGETSRANLEKMAQSLKAAATRQR